MKIRLGASAKFDNIKAVEIHTGSAYGHPGVIADIHMNDGKVIRQRDFADETYSNPADARLVADQETHRLASAAKRNGVPVIMHTTGRDLKRVQERDAYKSPSYTPRQQTAAETEADKRAMWTFIALVPVVCVIGGFLVYGLVQVP
jgi:histidinol phosphatase-like PHP family hydrolase